MNQGYTPDMDTFIYVCSHAPPSGTNASGVTTVVRIESHDPTMTRSEEIDTYERQIFITHYWAEETDLIDVILEICLKGYEMYTEMQGTHWELVSIGDSTIVTRFIYNYENMLSENLDEM